MLEMTSSPSVCTETRSWVSASSTNHLQEPQRQEGEGRAGAGPCFMWTNKWSRPSSGGSHGNDSTTGMEASTPPWILEQRRGGLSADLYEGWFLPPLTSMVLVQRG